MLDDLKHFQTLRADQVKMKTEKDRISEELMMAEERMKEMQDELSKKQEDMEKEKALMEEELNRKEEKMQKMQGELSKKRDEEEKTKMEKTKM